MSNISHTIAIIELISHVADFLTLIFFLFVHILTFMCYLIAYY